MRSREWRKVQSRRQDRIERKRRVKQKKIHKKKTIKRKEGRSCENSLYVGGGALAAIDGS